MMTMKKTMMMRRIVSKVGLLAVSTGEGPSSEKGLWLKLDGEAAKSIVRMSLSETKRPIKNTAGGFSSRRQASKPGSTSVT